MVEHFIIAWATREESYSTRITLPDGKKAAGLLKMGPVLLKTRTFTCFPEKLMHNGTAPILITPESPQAYQLKTLKYRLNSEHICEMPAYFAYTVVHPTQEWIIAELLCFVKELFISDFAQHIIMRKRNSNHIKSKVFQLRITLMPCGIHAN